MATVAAVAPPAQEQQVGPPLYRFTVEQYHRMSELGVLTENDRVELLEGRIVHKMTHYPPHAGSVWLVQTAFLTQLTSAWVVRVQSPITLSDSEPEPDVAVARGPGTKYLRAHPKPADLGLLVEVAESSLAEDRGTKVRVYARARIPIYWIVNLVDRQIEVYTQPRAGKSPTYRQQRIYRPDETIPLVLDGEEVAQFVVRDLLPPPLPA